ncbi:glycosyl hydrolase [Fulvivirgaceae bacterium BMA10]|uniref:Glycosyl hydrolase n=1 Tax=Splendidivirga corallicola TaxID=3051826 RepID=A0ABT8KV58_9BACT|nr:glycosyl hydrolase [Fulvivirgaceae bacterium BMA10]
MKNLFLTLVCLMLVASVAQAQKKKKSNVLKPDETVLSKTSLSGLKFRDIGPAVTSGRIADFAVNPKNAKEYYVATASGGVWKTVNAGTTFKPIFDGQGSYSIGCVTLDPGNPNVVWVGTGENNNQRSVAYGDGVYKSEDGGASWKHMGLKTSEHIGKIIIDPGNSNIVYVAAIGPLWKEGGERGVYKSIDGGNAWELILSIDEHTGVNDLIMDPDDPNVMYASAFQRRRHVFTYLGGGPGSGLYKTTDGGKTWDKINNGLPKVDLGRIGLDISPADPEIIYAIVEAAQGKGGFYRSTNRGASWKKMGGYSTSGNYYQEIIADPVNPDKVYAMDTWMRVSTDGGKNFKVVGEDFKHVDNHCMWIDRADTDHFLVGCDGGIYETWDAGKTWDFKANLPLMQFYKVAVDNSEPFYYTYGGTQDNFSVGGPSRTISGNGIANSDWFVTHGGDGFESQIDPNDPNIVYAQSQYGVLVRYDRSSGEELGIQPQERKGESAYRFNWDAPLVISNHKNTRIYFAANKVFRSDDRGNSWEVISDDLTRQINRNTLPVMGRVWGIDAVRKNLSTSPYGTIVAMDESPLNENLLYIGTDDGLIQVTENGGQSWRSSENFPGVPDRTYVNAVLSSQHNEQVVYACFNHHKYGDFKPYVYKSTDKGKTWVSITNNLPERGSSYAIAEDHVDPNLLFVGTEFGVFFSNDGGAHWKQLKNGIPTIAVRDIAIQKRENDLALATFGRGFLILDDYSVLRHLDKPTLAKEAELFATRDALSFEYSYPLGLPGKSFQGDSYYIAENLGSEAIFTYYLKEGIKTREEQRREHEKKNKEDGKNNAYPDYETLKAEREEDKPYLLFTIKDANNRIVRKLTAKPKTGVNRIKWDLRYASKNPINFSSPSFYNPFAGRDEGTLVAPGTYSVSLSKSVDGVISQIAGPVSFKVKSLNNTSLPAANREELVDFQRKIADLSRSLQGAQRTISEINDQLKHMREAINKAEVPQDEFIADLGAIEKAVREIQRQLNSDPVASTLDIDRPLTVGSRVGFIVYEAFYSTSTPTKTHRDSYAIAVEEFKPLLSQIKKLVREDIRQLQDKLENAGAPYTPYTLPDYTDH